MTSIRRTAVSALLLAAALSSGGCTLVKPVVGAVTGPAYVIGETDGAAFHGCYDTCSIAGFFIVSSAVGAVAGLVTGVISDFRVLAGHSSDPADNWFNPFAVN